MRVPLDLVVGCEGEMPTEVRRRLETFLQQGAVTADDLGRVCRNLERIAGVSTYVRAVPTSGLAAQWEKALRTREGVVYLAGIGIPAGTINDQYKVFVREMVGDESRANVYVGSALSRLFRMAGPMRSRLVTNEGELNLTALNEIVHTSEFEENYLAIDGAGPGMLGMLRRFTDECRRRQIV